MIISDSDPEFLEKRPILDNKYRVLDTIGEGRFAKVKMAVDLENEKTYAIKIMRESQINTSHKMENFIKEIQILSEIYHHHVIDILAVNLNGIYRKYDGRVIKVVYYVMKFAEYGELYNFLEHTSHFSENVARYYFQQIIEGIEYLHKHHIGHRDIKTENLLLDKSFSLKIADFGYATKFVNEKKEKILFSSSISVGSPEYNPPEITNSSNFENYSAEATDLFAAATMLFMMVMKSAPFNSSSFQDPYYSRLCKSEKSQFWKVFQNLSIPSDEFKSIIEKMLEFNSDKRLTISEIKEHPWYKGYLPQKDEIMEEMKSRGQSVIEVRRNELRRKREMKLNKMKYMTNYGKSMMEGKSANSRPNPKFESLKQKYQAIVDEVNKKLVQKKTKAAIPEKVGERVEIGEKQQKNQENMKKVMKELVAFSEKRDPDPLTVSKVPEDDDGKGQKKKREREKGRRRKKTQDDMNFSTGSNQMHINFMDDFQPDFEFGSSEENKKDSSSDEGRRSVRSDGLE